MGEAMRVHDAIVRAAIERNAGLVVKTGGDSFFAVFTQSGKAIAAAIDLQTELAAQDFSAIEGVSVRAAVHVGIAEERDGDYFGPTINRIGRLLQAAHGGQVIVTGLVVDLTRDQMPPGASFIDLGEHRLRDVSAPEHVFQLAWPGAPGEFPPLRTGIEQTNLPNEPAPVIGRENDLAALQRALERSKLVTITGPGGVGKTCLALRLGAEMRSAYPDGVWLVDLAAIERPDLVISEFETAVGFTRPHGDVALPSLVSALSRKSMLLIVDNCEHLLAAASEAILAILRGAPGIRIVATSREALRVAGELVYALEPLSLPPDDELSAEQALRFSAAQLFVERAQSISTFELTDANAGAVGSICRRLDGIPFAIELAAARTNILGAEQIAARLDERFRFLKSGRRDASPRQQTLHAMIDWSYSLLDEGQRVVFRKLAIFPGGWTLAAAAAVAGTDEVEVLEILGELADKSLVASDRKAEPRFRYLESTRDYAEAALKSAGEFEAAAAAQFAYLLDFARNAEAHYGDLREEAWIERIESESENVRSALEWSLGGEHDVSGGAELAVLLGRFWHLRRYHEGVHWLGEAEARSGRLDSQLQIRVLSELVRVDPFGPATLQRAERALEEARALGAPDTTARVLSLLAGTLINVGRYREAETLIAESRELAAGSNDVVLQCLALLVNAYAVLYDRRFNDAEPLFRESIALAQEGLRTRDRAMALRGLAFVFTETGRPAEAEANAREALHTFEQLDDRRGRGIASSGLSVVLLSAGHVAEAAAYALDAIRLLVDAQLFAGFCEAVVPLAASYEALGDHRAAARMIGYVQKHWNTPFRLPEFIQAIMNATLVRLEQRLTAGELGQLLAEGAMLDERGVARQALQGRLSRSEKSEANAVTSS